MKNKGYTLRSDLEKARASALASLSMREHSVFELSEKLKRKEYEQASIDIIIKECLGDNYLNDQRFAEIFWRSRARKGYGPKKISIELKQRGIDSDMAYESSQQEELNFDDVIKSIYQKKYKGSEITDFKDKLKRQNYLYQRGFGMDLIRVVIS